MDCTCRLHSYNSFTDLSVLLHERLRDSWGPQISALFPPFLLVTGNHTGLIGFLLRSRHYLKFVDIPVLGQVVKMIDSLFFVVSLLGVTVLRANQKGYVDKLGLGESKGILALPQLN